jgi:hypothetical protein
MKVQPIWHIKVRRHDHPDYEIAEIRMNGRRKPNKGEITKVGVINFGLNRVTREDILARVVSFTESTSGSQIRFTVLADEQDNGNPPDHREATEGDSSDD